MGTCRMAKGLKDPCRHVAGVGGQYKMYNSLIFINFISRSKKWNQKSKSCIKRLFSVNKLLRLRYFVSVLNLKFLDQLERRHCKDTPFFRPFYIGAPKGPFLWGLRRFVLFSNDFVESSAIQWKNPPKRRVPRPLKLRRAHSRSR